VGRPNQSACDIHGTIAPIRSNRFCRCPASNNESPHCVGWGCLPRWPLIQIPVFFFFLTTCGFSDMILARKRPRWNARERGLRIMQTRPLMGAKSASRTGTSWKNPCSMDWPLPGPAQPSGKTANSSIIGPPAPPLVTKSPGPNRAASLFYIPLTRPE